MYGTDTKFVLHNDHDVFLFVFFGYKQHYRFHWSHPVSKPPFVLMSVRRAVRKTPVFDRRLRTHAHVRVRVPLNVGSRGILLISTIYIGTYPYEQIRDDQI